MPKMKTRRSAAKRFKATATGEFKRAKLLEAYPGTQVSDP